jgi:hypothetical protein
MVPEPTAPTPSRPLIVPLRGSGTVSARNWEDAFVLILRQPSGRRRGRLTRGGYGGSLVAVGPLLALGALLIVLGALWLATAPHAYGAAPFGFADVVRLADTQGPKTEPAGNNNVVLGIVAVGVLLGVVILARPRRGPR